jgi:hypothetical protein
MPLITTAVTVTVLWAGLEVVGKALAEETAKAGVRPIANNIAAWIQQKTGWQEKHRQQVFADAYIKAEEALIEKYGMPSAYRVFRAMPRLVDSGQRERLVLTILESSDPQLLGASFQTQLQRSFPAMSNLQQYEHLRQFMSYLRQYLHETPEFSPLIEFYASEEAQQVREKVLLELTYLNQTVDAELGAIRVTIVEPSDFDEDRRRYLKRLEAFLEEQDFFGVPDLQESQRPVLVRDIFVPLSLRFDTNREIAKDETAQIVALQTITQKGD